MGNIRYKSGFKYQLTSPYSIKLLVNPKTTVKSKYISLTKTGTLTIREGYAWDGASGPTYDSKNSMRGGLVHDAIYQLMRMGDLPQAYRTHADKELYRLCREDGMSWIRARLWYRFVRRLAGFASATKNVKKIEVAP